MGFGDRIRLYHVLAFWLKMIWAIWVKPSQGKDVAMLLVNGKPACDPKLIELVAEMPTLYWLLHAYVLSALYLGIYFIDIHQILS